MSRQAHKVIAVQRWGNYDVSFGYHLGNILDPTVRRTMAAHVQMVVSQMFSKTPGHLSVFAMSIKCPEAFEDIYLRDLNLLFNSQKKELGIKKETAEYLDFLSGAFREQVRHDPSWFQKHRAEIGLLLITSVMTTVQMLTMFSRDTGDGEPEKAWLLNDGVLHHSYIFLHFLKFFTSVLTAVGGLLWYHHARENVAAPPIPLSTLGNEGRRLNFLVEASDLEGVKDSSRPRGTAQFLQHPPLLTQFNQEIFPIAFDQLSSEAVALLMDTIDGVSKGKVSLGGGIEQDSFVKHITSLFVFFQKSESVLTPEDHLHEHSARVDIKFDIPSVVVRDAQIDAHIVCMVKRAILSVPLFPRFKGADGKSLSHGADFVWKNGFVSHIPNMLSLSNLGLNRATLSTLRAKGIDPRKYVLWSPPIQNGIRFVTECAIRLNHKVDGPFFLEYWNIFFDQHQRKVLDLEVRSWLDSQPNMAGVSDVAASSHYKTIFDQDASLSRDENTRIFPHASIRMTSLFREWQTAQATFLAPIIRLLGEERPIIQHELKAYLASPEVVVLMKKNPLIVMAGCDREIERLLEILENRLLEIHHLQTEYPDDYARQLPTPFQVLVSDQTVEDVTASFEDFRQYSSGKTTFLRGLSQMFSERCKELGVETPVGTIFRADMENQFLWTKKPDGDEPPGCMERVWGWMKTHFRVEILPLLAQDVAYDYLHFQIFSKILSDSDDWGERYSAAIFPWIMFGVNMALTLLFSYKLSEIDETFFDQHPWSKIVSTDPDVVSLDKKMTRDSLLGKTGYALHNPQKYLSENKQIGVLNLMMKIALIENGQDFFDTDASGVKPGTFEMLTRMIRQKTAFLGGVDPVDWGVLGLFMSSNSTDPSHLLKAADAGFEVVERTSVLSYSHDEDALNVLSALLLVQLVPHMQMNWSRTAMLLLIENCLLPGQKFFFGARFLQRQLVQDIEREAVVLQDIVKMPPVVSEPAKTGLRHRHMSLVEPRVRETRFSDPIIEDEHVISGMKVFLDRNPDLVRKYGLVVKEVFS